MTIIDFGLSISQVSNIKGFVGSTHYICPEILKDHYDEKCDIWSIGVVTYVLFSQGEFPFEGTNQSQIFKSIKRGEFYLPPKRRKENIRRKKVV